MIHPAKTCLWFDGLAQAVAEFYATTFPGARKTGDSGLVATVEVGGLELMLLNGGPDFKPNPAISFFYNCDNEDGLDALWAALSAGGSVLMPLDHYPFAKKYGWVADKFGVNWQLILPDAPPKARAFPSLMFTGANAGRAEEAISFYSSLLPGSGTGTLSRYGPDQAPDREGSINYGEFSLQGQWFSAMDSAWPHGFTFTEGTSLVLTCDTQEEIDRLWTALAEGGEEGRCGWLKDSFGLSWQVVPSALETLMSDPERSQRVVAAFMKMGKLDIETLRRA
jgi:predicted 3-demethylubiquinone-9 3-methyltransferase (glyoxalase superfamily)